ncbi:DUF4377 domain-containing protein [Chryseobacterium gallinarum]|uniref:DUF4377 domain-containing protein n=1 Tax=Chryseobacterium gallinarum TaxID=1324352 RepID=UPI00202543BD|nr:DUF4377 domain-containing protein [Chryseobacterium gallinarum]MCL8538404.1 DUF4377 domain-containing protein [Chryseobacterium gallinarum]
MKSIATILKGTAPALALFAMTQCTTIPGGSPADEKTFIVGPQTADCTGVAPMKCLQVKEKASENWTNLYTNIEGFTYEPGYEYVLKVKTEKIANPPADGSSIKYTLVKQVSKTKKEKADANEKTLIVGAQTADCSAGAGRMKCLQVKENASENWTNFYSNIEGFTYEPGYEYVLKVKTEKIANPPADASSIKYILTEQVSKTKK